MKSVELLEDAWNQRQSKLEKRLQLLTQKKNQIQTTDYNSTLSLQKYLKQENPESLKDQFLLQDDRCSHLERTNQYLTQLIVEKDELLSKFLNDQSAQQNEALHTNDIPQLYASTVTEFSIADYDENQVSDEWTAASIQQQVGRGGEQAQQEDAYESVRLQHDNQELQKQVVKLQGKLKAKEDQIRTLQMMHKEKSEGDTRFYGNLQQMDKDLQEMRQRLLKGMKEKGLLSDEIVKLKAKNKRMHEQLQKMQYMGKTSDSKHELQFKINELQNQLKQSQEQIQNQSEIIDILQTQPKPVTITQECIEKAVQQLSLIILSKDQAKSIDSKGKDIIKQIFGNNIQQILEQYEERVEIGKTDKRMWRQYYQEEIEKKMEYLNETIDILRGLQKLGVFVQQRNWQELLKLQKRIKPKKSLIAFEKRLIEAKNMYQITARDNFQSTLNTNQIIQTKEVDSLKAKIEELAAQTQQFRQDENIKFQLQKTYDELVVVKEEREFYKDKVLSNDILVFMTAQSIAIEDLLIDQQDSLSDELSIDLYS